VISLLEKEEEQQLELAEEGRPAESGGVRFISFPIADRGVIGSAPDAVSLLRPVK